MTKKRLYRPDINSLDNFGLEASNEDLGIDANEEWKWAKMPEYRCDNKKKAFSVMVDFETWEDVEKFAKLLDQTITERTKYIWYPAKEKQQWLNWAYVNGNES